MHTILHPFLAQAVSPVEPPPGRPRPPRRGHPPPRQVRRRAARALAVTASRLDRESARRALA